MESILSDFYVVCVYFFLKLYIFHFWLFMYVFLHQIFCLLVFKSNSMQKMVL